LGYGNKITLHEAALNGQLEILKLLIEDGSNINLIDNYNGRTPLHFAALSGHLKIVKLLIKNGIDINIKDKSGKTAEDIACNKEVSELIKTTKLQKTLLERQEVLIKETNRIFDIITRYTKLIDITYLISLKRK